MKLDDNQKEIAAQIYNLLVGETIKSAKEILKAVELTMKNFAVIQKGGGQIE